MIKNVAYGSEKEGKYYVQTCCSEEHFGQECDCKTLVEDVSEEIAKNIAHGTAAALNAPLEFWGINKNNG